MPNPLRRLIDNATFAPFRTVVFRNLWLATFAANIAMWMNDVTAAWVMTSLTTSPVMVALVQTASTLPVFLLGLPSGALADIIDRRRYFAVTQLWVAMNALLLATLSLTGTLTAPLLLALTFANGIGLAMRWPVFSAIVPEVVPREHLGSAMALNGISMNLSRVVGPVVAGAIISAVGSGAVFALNVVLAAAAFVTIVRWRSTPRTSTLPGERFVGAMRVGWQHVMQSPRMKAVLVRIFFFFLHSSALLALLPLVARELHGAGPGTYTVMLACIGGGAVVAAFYFPRWRARFDRDQFVVGGTLAHAAMSVIVVFAPNIWIALPAIVVLGMAWISTANSLTLAAQVALPNWVRARMAIYQMALMGGAAAGSLLWGQVAGWTSVPIAVTAAAVAGPLLWLATRRLSVEGGADPDFSPVPAGSPPQTAISVAPDEGPVMVTLEYQVDPADAEAFADVMQKTRARLRQGALSWGLFRDTAAPGRYIEYFVDESWVEHLRRLERFTVADAGLREKRLAFHRGAGPPVVRRFVAEGLQGRGPALLVSTMDAVDCVVVGAGVVGLTVARALAQAGREVVVLEAAEAIGTATSSRNSEVIHAGLYYPPGSWKARLCVRGRQLLYDYCAAHGVAHRRCGKLVVATDAAQEPSLRDLRERAAACGVHDLQWLSAAEAQALEPALRCSAALLSPSTGIVDSHGLMLSLQGEAEALGAMLALQSPLQRLRRRADGFELQVGGAEPMPLRARCVVNSAGLHAVALASRIEGLPPLPLPQAHWARGHYFACAGKPAFTRLIYPMPDEAGLGVHVTLDLAGQMRFGPDVQWIPLTDLGAEDYRVDPARAAPFADAIRRYWPGLPEGALTPTYAGIRPKISGPGQPAADFLIQGPAQHGVPGLVNLLGIESPGLTAALAIGEQVAAELCG